MAPGGNTTDSFRFLVNVRLRSCMSLDEPYVILDACNSPADGLRFVLGDNGTLHHATRPNWCLSVADEESWMDAPDVHPGTTMMLSRCKYGQRGGQRGTLAAARSSDRLPRRNQQFAFYNDGTIHPMSDRDRCLNVAGGVGLPGPWAQGLAAYGDGAHVIAYPCSTALNEVWRPDGLGIDWKPNVPDPADKTQDVALPFNASLLLACLCVACCLCFLAYTRCCCCCAEIFGRSRAKPARDSMRLLESSAPPSELADCVKMASFSSFSASRAGADVASTGAGASEAS